MVSSWSAVGGFTATHILNGHSDMVISVAWSPDGKRLASASTDETVRQWDVVTRQVLRPLDGHFGTVVSVVWSPDGKLLAFAGYDTVVRLWDVIPGVGIITTG